MERVYYIYNNDQAIFYFSKGIVPCGSGKGKRGDDYVKFINSAKLQEAFAKWCNR